MKVNPTLSSLNKSPTQTVSKTGDLKRPAETKRNADIKKQSQKLEAVFITQMIKAMEKTIPKSSLGGTKNTLSAMMFSTVLGDAIAEQGGVGLSDMIYQSLIDRDNHDQSNELDDGILPADMFDLLDQPFPLTNEEEY